MFVFSTSAPPGIKRGVLGKEDGESVFHFYLSSKANSRQHNHEMARTVAESDEVQSYHSSFLLPPDVIKEAIEMNKISGLRKKDVYQELRRRYSTKYPNLIGKTAIYNILRDREIRDEEALRMLVYLKKKQEESPEFFFAFSEKSGALENELFTVLHICLRGYKSADKSIQFASSFSYST